MAICGAINKYGYTGFHLYILEILSEDSSKEDILEKEDFWAKKIKPSYNIFPKIPATRVGGFAPDAEGLGGHPPKIPLGGFGAIYLILFMERIILNLGK